MHQIAANERKTHCLRELSIGKLSLWIDDLGTGINVNFPPIYHEFEQFSVLDHAEISDTFDQQTSSAEANLVLELHGCPIPEAFDWGHLVHHNIIWELWQNSRGRFIFRKTSEPNNYCIIVESNFERGQVIGEQLSALAEAETLLSSLDLPLYANWLGGYGDLILHSASVVVAGQGYCFAGPSGVGKSTLAAFLATHHDLTVLGEDHIILRYLDGKFWIFGSPWHENLALCAPMGVPLKKLIFIDRGANQGIESISPLEGVARVLQTAFVPYYRSDLTAQILGRLAKLAEEIPFFRLNYQLGTDPYEWILRA